MKTTGIVRSPDAGVAAGASSVAGVAEASAASAGTIWHAEGGVGVAAPVPSWAKAAGADAPSAMEAATMAASDVRRAKDEDAVLMSVQTPSACSARCTDTLREIVAYICDTWERDVTARHIAPGRERIPLGSSPVLSSFCRIPGSPFFTSRTLSP